MTSRLFVLALLFVAGCSVGSATTATDSEAFRLVCDPPVCGWGEYLDSKACRCVPYLCGPDAPGHATCPSGFTCQMDALDIGHCVQDPTGQLCGPTVSNGLCPTGYQCVPDGIDTGHCEPFTPSST